MDPPLHKMTARETCEIRRIQRMTWRLIEVVATRNEREGVSANSPERLSAACPIAGAPSTDCRRSMVADERLGRSGANPRTSRRATTSDLRSPLLSRGVLAVLRRGRVPQRAFVKPLTRGSPGRQRILGSGDLVSGRCSFALPRKAFGRSSPGRILKCTNSGFSIPSAPEARIPPWFRPRLALRSRETGRAGP